MDAQEYAFVKHKIFKLMGVNLDNYKSTQMERRLQAFLTRSGYANWSALFRAIQNDPAQITKLKNYLTINVSYFFRDADKYEYLQKNILPGLLQGRAKLRVWSAGCSRGHEPYTLAMILAELTSPYHRHQITATDMDSEALAWAQAGGPYTVEEVSSIPTAWLNRYFSLRGNQYWFSNTALRRKLAFVQHDLMAQPFVLPNDAADGYDLIVCRNVVIYFTAEGKSRLYCHLRDALRPGGVLFVGGTEIISKAAEIGFQVMSMSFYRRTDPGGRG